MEGRETGTRGYRMASAYVAERFADIGLQPAGDNGTFFQRVPLLKATRERDGARSTVNRNGRSIALRFQDQFLPRSEEHTSELQPLISNSYAVFCLKKKTTTYILLTMTLYQTKIT